MKNEKIPLVVEIFLAIEIWSFSGSDNEWFPEFEYVTVHSHKLL
jgi:hypothetical protein